MVYFGTLCYKALKRAGSVKVSHDILDYFSGTHGTLYRRLFHKNCLFSHLEGGHLFQKHPVYILLGKVNIPMHFKINDHEI